MNVLFLGTIVSGYRPYRAVIEDLASRIAGTGWATRTASASRGRASRLWGTLAAIVAARRWADVAQVDVFSGKAFMMAEVTCAALRLVRIPYVLTLHGGGLPEFASRHEGRVRRLLHSARAVTAPSGYLREGLADIHAGIVLIPNAIDLGVYRMRVRDQIAPRLIWLRAFHRIYNPTLAPRVLAIVRRAHSGATLVMIGPDRNDGSMSETRDVINKLGLDKHVRVIPGLPKGDIPGVLDADDVFLNTSNVDNAPVTLLEAMATGLCIVSTEVGGVPFLVEHKVSALLVPPDDPDAMAIAILDLLDDPSLAGRVSRGARAIAERHSWDSVLLQWRRVLRAAARVRN